MGVVFGDFGLGFSLLYAVWETWFNETFHIQAKAGA